MPRAYTADYLALKARLTSLTHLLPPAPAAGATPSRQDADKMAAFVILLHAECEHFLEKRALKVADEAKAAFDSGGDFGRVARHLCVFPFIDAPKQMSDLEKMLRIFGTSGFGIMASAKSIAQNRIEYGRLLNIGYQRYKQTVTNNHGAALKYQFKLLTALGFDLDLVGATFKSRIAQLATYRGEAAHTSVVAATTAISSPTLATWPADLMYGFAKMDRGLSSLATMTK
ncbi:MAG: hypothetical protein ACOY4N_05400 [Pseudomonadota bacterium]|uniref:RiboL-PSP-HEPN domain-containing protein n=2 Tax=Sphingomonadaceae TaxID=41297 RepID=A0A249MUE0_SPHXE|nr:hypothetical protein [Sphingobium xenophagum]ASY44794.1 hypothetical protein CJD35_10285 [Sphingobium xenophagum]QWT14865.1 hypothetical protein GTV57_03600 [Sphingobium xenophagum]|tara:strand:+ start:1252 stop:1938 length:687 start_codon:yes stop_codon:yes gene_type:complete